MSMVERKPALCIICKQQRPRSAYATQSEQCLCNSLFRKAIIPIITEISSQKLASVATQTVSCLLWSESTEAFLSPRHIHMYVDYV